MPRKDAAAIGEPGWRPTEVHPLAALFPMMHADELAELAEDILTNGLMQPIVVDADGVLIDGRNRLAACEQAGINPTYQWLNGHDATAFIVSANLARRNLSKGQQAMALAMIYPEPEKGGRGKRSQIQESFDEPRKTVQNRLSQARAVRSHSMALAEAVMVGRTALDAALAQVQREREASASVDARMAELRERAPDIAAGGRRTADAGGRSPAPTALRAGRVAARWQGFCHA